MRAGRWIQDEGSALELEAMNPIGVFDTKLAAVKVLRIFEEEGGVRIGANPDRSDGGCRMALSTWGPKDCRPEYRLKGGGRGSAALKKGGLWLRDQRMSSPTSRVTGCPSGIWRLSFDMAD